MSGKKEADRGSEGAVFRERQMKVEKGCFEKAMES